MHERKPLAARIRCAFPAVAAACTLALAAGAAATAADAPKAESAKSKPMNMDEPMAGGMKKEGMKVGDVKKAAEKWDRKMRKMIEKEQQSGASAKK